MFFRLNRGSKRDAGAAACLILIVVCSPAGGKSRWNIVDSAVRQGVRHNVSERWMIDAFKSAGNARVCSRDANVNAWKRPHPDIRGGNWKS